MDDWSLAQGAMIKDDVSRASSVLIVVQIFQGRVTRANERKVTQM